MKTKGRIERSGTVTFHDSNLSVWEEGSPQDREWQRRFKREVFARIIQTLNRIGWTVGEWDSAEEYKAIALSRRTCSKGELKGELGISGRCIEFKMRQDVTPSVNPNGGRYDFDKAERMPYVMRLEMERTRRRIRDYLCNVFTGYAFEDKSSGRSAKRGLLQLTAMEWIAGVYRESWHFKGDTTTYKIDSYNSKSADGGAVEHGKPVWFFDSKGRMQAGIAYYNINNMWWVALGQYDVANKASFELHMEFPGNPRLKRNDKLRQKSLERQMQKAIEVMNFERAAVLRDVLYPAGSREPAQQ